MNLTKLIALSGLVLLSCKKEESERPTVTTFEKNVSKKDRQIDVENIQTASFKIEGMTCAIGCAKTIEKELSNLDGVEKAIVDFEKKSAIVVYDRTVQNTEILTVTVKKVGDGKTYKVSEIKI
ncbi:heavy-metal-associated domain-containing protein [Flavobacterium olei]|uniref:heavy-metal-associated domain-containing protein n=1 Tax=Flavobacterium olei TaxID=1886782 RepID=UPI00321B5145